MAVEDMRRVAPLWLEYTERVRQDPLAFNLTGDAYAKKPGGWVAVGVGLGQEGWGQPGPGRWVSPWSI